MTEIVQLVENGEGKFMKTHVLAIEGLKSYMLDFVYPIGSVVPTTNATNPSEYWGGTWERFAKGRTLVGVDESDAALDNSNKQGGSTNPLTEHTQNFSGTTAAASIVGGVTSGADVKFQGASSGGGGIKSQTHVHNFSGTTDKAGNNKDHANWQPFATVYFWKRTA